MKPVMGKLLALLLCCLLPVIALAEAPGLGEDDFAFRVGEDAYRLGDIAEPFLDAIEERYGLLTVTEADSCMFTGKDKEYAGEELLIATYPIGPNGEDVIETIFVVAGAHETARGISIGATREAVIAAYGEGYTIDYDQMIYAMGDPLTEPLLVFVFDLGSDTVISFYMIRNTIA